MTGSVIDGAWLADFIKWNFATFGPGQRTAGTIDHIRKELLEIEDAPSDVSEWADVILLAFNGLARLGLSPEQIIETIISKQAVNVGRNWPDWRSVDPLKAVGHIDDTETFNPFGSGPVPIVPRED